MSTPIDTDIQIATSENIAFRHELAGPFRRGPAYVVDLLLRVVFLGLAALILLWLTPVLRSVGFASPAILLLSWFLLEWFYGGLFEAYANGQTPGKKLFGLRVVSADGRPINGQQAILRNILRAIDVMPIVPLSYAEGSVPILPTCMVSLLFQACSSKYQRFGDLVCGTIVVVEDTHCALDAVPLEADVMRRITHCLPPRIRSNRSLNRALATYVARRRNFSGARQHEIAGHLARRLIPQWGLDPGTDPDHLLCALYHQLFVALLEPTGFGPRVASPAVSDSESRGPTPAEATGVPEVLGS